MWKELMVTRLTGNGLPPPFCIWSWKTGGNLRRTLGSKSGWPSCKSRSGFSETQGGQACNDKQVPIQVPQVPIRDTNPEYESGDASQGTRASDKYSPNTKVKQIAINKNIHFSYQHIQKKFWKDKNYICSTQREH